MQGLHQGRSNVGMGTGRDQGRGLATRHLQRKTRPTEHAAAQLRCHLAGHLMAHQSLGALLGHLKAFAQPSHHAGVVAQGVQHLAQTGHGRADDDHVCPDQGRLRAIEIGATDGQRLGQVHPGQIALVAPLTEQGLGLYWAARPKGHMGRLARR